jgi:hypothetical protein
MAQLPAILIMVAGIVGCAPVDSRLAWVLVFVAGLLMVI